MEIVTADRLLRAFQQAYPHVVSFEYRKESHKRWKSALRELEKSGVVKLVTKTSSHSIYEYIGRGAL